MSIRIFCTGLCFFPQNISGLRTVFYLNAFVKKSYVTYPAAVVVGFNLQSSSRPLAFGELARGQL